MGPSTLSHPARVLAWSAVAALPALAALSPEGHPPAPDQANVVDAGSFVILRGTQAVGREEFTIRRGRASGGPGFTIAANASYPAQDPRVTVAAVVELGPDSLPAAVQLDVFGNGQRRVYALFGPRRLNIRVVRPNGETAREFPSSGRNFVADDSVLALYAIPPGSGEGTVQIVSPRQEQRAPGQLEDRGMRRTPVAGIARTLRLLVLETGDESRNLWYDEAGRLIKVDLPSRGITAERVERRP